MPVSTQNPTLGDLLKFELNSSYNREAVTLKAGTNYVLGAVLGKITATGKYRLSPNALVVGDEGAETATAVLIEPMDATGGDKVGLIAARGPALFAKDRLVFDASVNDAAKRATKHTQLSTVGLVPRDTA
jgi:hypothetical protein